jgi:hypothetical protein
MVKTITKEPDGGTLWINETLSKEEKVAVDLAFDVLTKAKEIDLDSEKRSP